MPHPLERLLLADDSVHVGADGQMLPISSGRCPPAKALLPGSFNPVHRGHWELAAVAERLLGQAVAFELSVANVDKPPLAAEEIRRRLAQFDGQAAVWLTRAPLFAEKAARFPGGIFVVGADTALRIVSPRYYDGSEERMRLALAEIRSHGCRFLVACRADAGGLCCRLSDVKIPAAFADLFTEIAPEQFRRDVSSTALRINRPRAQRGCSQRPWLALGL